MMLLYQQAPIFVHGFNHQLGSLRRDLDELKAQHLLLGTVEALRAIGYRHNFGLGGDETLLSLTTTPLSSTLQSAGGPRALVFQHCYAESAVLPYDVNETDVALRNRYFPAEVMRELQLDHLPYFCSFASGCAGFISVLIAAGGLFPSPDERPAICIMADSMPPGIPFNMLRERILGSDHSSAFVVGHEQYGYQLLGINYYSTTRTAVPFVEIVKRTVQMVQELATGLDLDLAGSDVAIHYPNIFPDTWRMVTHYLGIPDAEHVMDGMADRGHCMASDSVISLVKLYRGQRGRLHVVVNYGVGLHLGVCILEERDTSKGNV
jgi:3-oxoacyl-[acyl-carrier-protein] synthase III